MKAVVIEGGRIKLSDEFFYLIKIKFYRGSNSICSEEGNNFHYMGCLRDDERQYLEMERKLKKIDDLLFTSESNQIYTKDKRFQIVKTIFNII
jgi:hypothetical protein